MLVMHQQQCSGSRSRLLSMRLRLGVACLQEHRNWLPNRRVQVAVVWA